MSAARKFALVFLAMILTGCGFTPMYGDHSALNGEGMQSTLNAIEISNIPDREGQYLRNALIDRFYTGGRPVDPKYLLIITPIQQSKLDLGITPTGDNTREELVINTSMTLRDKASGQTLVNRDLVARVSYNVLASQFTTDVSEDAVRLNGLDDLSRQIEQQLALYFARAAQK